MKKLLCILLIAVLLLPSAVLADDPDPIVGCWYMFYDKNVAPELEPSYPGLDLYYSIYYFHESGVVYCGGVQISDTAGTPEYSSCGKWKKTDYQYEIGIIGLGEGKAFIENNELYSEIPGANGYYMRLHKLIPFNPYQDFVRK